MGDNYQESVSSNGTVEQEVDTVLAWSNHPVEHDQLSDKPSSEEGVPPGKVSEALADVYAHGPGLGANEPQPDVDADLLRVETNDAQSSSSERSSSSGLPPLMVHRQEVDSDGEIVDD